MAGFLSSDLKEVISVFLKLGFTAFGGPAAHVSIMHDEVVKRRKWLTDEEVPGPAGRHQPDPGSQLHRDGHPPGLPAGRLEGTCWREGCVSSLPATLIVLVLAWLYARIRSAAAGWTGCSTASSRW